MNVFRPQAVSGLPQKSLASVKPTLEHQVTGEGLVRKGVSLSAALCQVSQMRAVSPRARTSPVDRNLGNVKQVPSQSKCIDVSQASETDSRKAVAVMAQGMMMAARLPIAGEPKMDVSAQLFFDLHKFSKADVTEVMTQLLRDRRHAVVYLADRLGHHSFNIMDAGDGSSPGEISNEGGLIERLTYHLDNVPSRLMCVFDVMQACMCFPHESLDRFFLEVRKELIDVRYVVSDQLFQIKKELSRRLMEYETAGEKREVILKSPSYRAAIMLLSVPIEKIMECLQDIPVSDVSNDDNSAGVFMLPQSLRLPKRKSSRCVIS